jgi:hypothetical protein
MSMSKRPQYRSRRSGPPPWLVFLLGVAAVFGVYYLAAGFQDFVESGGLGIREATQQAALIATATRERLATREAVSSTRLATARPSPTDVPPCEMFVVSVPIAIIRAAPDTNADIIDQVPSGTDICVIARESDTDDIDWLLIDYNPRTRRLDPAYIREDLVRAANPTPTPSMTFTPLPTVTDAPISPTPTP